LPAASANPERAEHEHAVVLGRRAAHQALFDTIHRLRRSGRNGSQIVRETGISRSRLDKWLRFEELPERNKMAPKPDSPAFFRDYLAMRWKAGCSIVRILFDELRPMGYTGCFSGLARFVSSWRTGEQVAVSDPIHTVVSDSLPGDHAARHISSRVAAALLVKPRPLLTPAQANKVDALKKACPEFSLLRGLVMKFRGILRSGDAEALGCWMRKANDCGIYSMKRFAKTLRRDWAAVRNALQETFSNGPVEGHINRLKTIKRQMYGRAGFQLLRARLLPPSFPMSIPFHQS